MVAPGKCVTHALPLNARARACRWFTLHSCVSVTRQDVTDRVTARVTN